MGIFYNPPPPPTANNAGTPPEPHVPIGTQGNQPPRRTTALMMAVVLMSWPQDLEPRLARPHVRTTTSTQRTRHRSRIRAVGWLVADRCRPPDPEAQRPATKDRATHAGLWQSAGASARAVGARTASTHSAVGTNMGRA